MKNLRVANRYAKALLGLAEENNHSVQTFEDMQLIYKTLEQSKELQAVLKSPIVRISKKLNVVKGIFENKIGELTLHYLSIITRKKRALLIMGIAHEYLKIHRENLDIELVTLVTSSKEDKSILEKASKIAMALSEKSKIEFNHVINPDIIGGFILHIGDLRYDASIRKKLFLIKKQLLEN